MVESAHSVSSFLTLVPFFFGAVVEEMKQESFSLFVYFVAKTTSLEIKSPMCSDPEGRLDTFYTEQSSLLTWHNAELPGKREALLKNI